MVAFTSVESGAVIIRINTQRSTRKNSQRAMRLSCLSAMRAGLRERRGDETCDTLEALFVTDMEVGESVFVGRGRNASGLVVTLSIGNGSFCAYTPGWTRCSGAATTGSGCVWVWRSGDSRVP